MKLTKQAAHVMLDRLKHRGAGLGIRVGVRTAGCSGYEYALEYVDSLNSDDTVFKNRGVNLIKTAKKWSFKTAPDLASMMQKEKIVQRKLSKAATETLAIIAYHQPVTRAEVEDIRGVHFSPGTLDVLMELNWVRPIGRKKIPGRPIIYGTTERFLEYFGLEQVTDLPGLEELKAAGLLESRLPPNLDIREPQEVDHSQIEAFGEDENIDDLIHSGHETE